MRTLRVVLLPEADDAEHENSDGFLKILFVTDNKIHGSCHGSVGRGRVPVWTMRVFPLKKTKTSMGKAPEHSPAVLPNEAYARTRRYLCRWTAQLIDVPTNDSAKK